MQKKTWTGSRRWTLCVALFAAAYLLFMGNLLFANGRVPGESYRYNLIPFETVKPLLLEKHKFTTEAWVKNLFGNIVLFIPLGLWIPVLFPSFRTFFRFTAAVIVLLLAVELTQLVTRVGTFDVDDLMLNTLGAWLGYAMCRGYVRVRFGSR